MRVCSERNARVLRAKRGATPGHSSLSRLKSLAIDELKIDRFLIFDLNENEEGKTIVGSGIHRSAQARGLAGCVHAGARRREAGSRLPA